MPEHKRIPHPNKTVPYSNRKVGDITVEQLVEAVTQARAHETGVYHLTKERPDLWPDEGMIHIAMLQKLGIDYKRLKMWEKRYNLTAVKEGRDIWYSLPAVKAILMDRYKRDNKKEVA